MTNTHDTKQVKRFEDTEARAWSHSYHKVECEVQVDFADCKFFNIKGLTKTFNMEGTMQVKLCVYRTKDFSRKYGKRVKALGGTFTHCRGHNYDRWVTVPFRSVDGWRHCLTAKQLIFDMCADADLHREGWSHELYILAPFVCDQGFRNMVQVRRWSWACKNPFGFAHDALADSVRVIQSLNDTGKACFAQGTGQVSLFEIAEDGSLYDQEWLEMTPVALPAPAEAPAETTEDTNTTPNMPSAEELESDAFKAFAAEMKALLADVPDALPADMSDAHTMLCVQFSVDKRQYNPCREYEWTTELAQCGGELTVQQGIMQFTVPLQTFRQRELFKTLHECSILDDPEMEGARQYLFTQVVLPLARWGCDAQPQVNTALVECMYYENAFTLIEEGYKACRDKLQ